ncbi:MAG: HIT family protein [Alphaproteobacteria bacterium]
MTATFELHPQLDSDSHDVATLALCRLRLLDDARYPWLLLVPQRAAVTQILDLDVDDQQLLWDEIRFLTTKLNELWRPARVNLGISGIIVPQLHVHLIARFENDAAWPRPVWNIGVPTTYPADLLASRLQALRAALEP